MENLDMAQKETLAMMHKTFKVDGVIKVLEKSEHSGKDTRTDCTQEGNNSDLERNNPSGDKEPINLLDTVEENQVTDKEAIAATMEKRNDLHGGIVLKEGRCLLNKQGVLDSDSTFLVDHDHDYVCAENFGGSLDDERGLYSTKEPPDRGFHSEEDVVACLECVGNTLLFSVDSSSAAAFKQFTHYLSAQTDYLQLISFLDWTPCCNVQLHFFKSKCRILDQHLGADFHISLLSTLLNQLPLLAGHYFGSYMDFIPAEFYLSWTLSAGISEIKHQLDSSVLYFSYINDDRGSAGICFNCINNYRF
ncbi:unnamed protein product [Ilex paraguariensis]|uniref:Uncharacterized protein n=1 Tax=Ilex paraguariensis TaxID=185542 RepID=A0ABC8T0G7_9AQUA